MSNQLDMSQYLDLFIQEAEEQLTILEQEVMKLEEDPSIERLQIIFRAAHTLKGSSRAMDFQNMAALTHEMENVLDKLRNNELEVTTPLADALLSCIDTLSQMRDEIQSGNGDNVDSTELVKRLIAEQSCQTNLEPVPSSAPAPIAPRSAALSPEQVASMQLAHTERPVYHGTFRLSEDCVMKFVRAFMAISMIQESGELLVANPPTDKLEEEEFEHHFELYFQVSENIDELKKKFATISELADFEVGLWAASEAVIDSDHSPAETEASLAQSVIPVDEPTAASANIPDLTKKTNPTEVKKSDSGQTVRVDVTRLDNLMNLVGELVIDRTRIAQIGADLSSKYQDSNIDALAETVGHIHRITSDLQDQIMKARMLPIETVFNRFPRVVRDLASKLGKDVKLDLIGGETELDRSVIEVIGDPLLHILRNSVDHGLETQAGREQAGKPKQGHITVSARHQENHIVIEIIDDGKGIDVERIKTKAIESGLLTKDAAERLSDKEALQFIFVSGLSTAAEVTETSGRGVGMDIVRSNIQKLGGLIDLDTTMGKGTKFSLRLPLTLAIIRGLLVRVAGVVYVLPLGSVIETMLVSRSQIQTVKNREVIVIRGVTTPIVRMREVFRNREFCTESANNELYAVIVGIAEQRVGLIVDSLIGEQEVVIKSLSRYCGDVSGVSGATILGDGNVALIVDVNGMISSERN